ncbi:MAG: RNA polymerase sigma factor [Planctomycetota bacterium]|jgi:RNA polymerase sigma-70 factor (ECF subfamily)
MEAASAVPEPPSVTDEALAARLIGGDQRAFDQLVLRWRDRVVDLARLLTGDADAAEDVGQEVFLRFLRRPGAFDPRRPFKAWIMTVTRNLCHDRYRRESARTKYQRIATEERHYGPRAAPLPAEEATLREGQAELRVAIAELAPHFKEAYVLCAVRGMSYDEAAGICGCPAKTLSTRLARARKQLLARMEKWL